MVLIERDQDGFYVDEVSELRGCHTQARSLDELMARIRELSVVKALAQSLGRIEAIIGKD